MISLPIVQQTSRIDSIGQDPDTLFVTCASYEDRSAAVVDQFSDAYSADSCRVFVCEEYRSKGKTEQNLSRIRERLQVVTRRDPAVSAFGIDNPVAFLSELRQVLSGFRSGSSGARHKSGKSSGLVLPELLESVR